MTGPAPTAELIARLERSEPSARRMAVLDLGARVPSEPDAATALIGRLGVEADERARTLICRALAGVEAPDVGRRAMEALAAIRDDDATSAPLAHAAILAHDRLERRFAAR